MGHPDFDYQIDINITQADGMIIKVMNGTSFDSAGDLKYINLRDSNALWSTWNAPSTSQPGKPNQVFVMITTDPEYEK